MRLDVAASDAPAFSGSGDGIEVDSMLTNQLAHHRRKHLSLPLRLPIDRSGRRRRGSHWSSGRFRGLGWFRSNRRGRCLWRDRSFRFRRSRSFRRRRLRGFGAGVLRLASGVCGRLARRVWRLAYRVCGRLARRVWRLASGVCGLLARRGRFARLADRRQRRSDRNRLAFSDQKFGDDSGSG
jgi:hypothetical protein